MRVDEPAGFSGFFTQLINYSTILRRPYFSHSYNTNGTATNKLIRSQMSTRTNQTTNVLKRQIFVALTILSLVLRVTAAGQDDSPAIPYRTASDSGVGSHPADKTSPSRRCEPITIPLCQRIGYNMTSFPNAYGHERQEEAGLEVHQFYPLVEVNCYKHLKFFLCSMYTPICQDNYELSVPPCREVCLEARRNCAPLMQKYGFRWPATLECDDRLPRMADQERIGRICAAPPDTVNTIDAVEDETASQKPNESQRSQPPHPKSQPTPPSKPKSQPPIVDADEAQCACRCTRPFHSLVGARHASARLGVNYRVQNVSDCAYACHSPAIYSPEDRAFFNTWLAIWSGICMTLSLFTVLTFLTDVERFPYPERPIFFLALCQLMIAAGFMLRVVYGHERVACDANGSLLKVWASLLKMLAQPSSGLSQMGPADGGDPLCLLIFVLLYFFGMAASAWWVVLSLSWVLAAVPHWSTEWIAKYSAYFHLFAWLTPATQTLLVLAFGAVDGDPVSGVCFVGNTSVFNLHIFVLGPLIVYFAVGVSFLSIGFLNLWGIRSSLKKTHPGVDKTSKLTQLMSKIGIFSVLYTVPALFVVLVLFYEQHHRDGWEQAALCSCAPPADSHQNGTLLLLALIKSASMLVVGWTSGVWILSAKTLASWRRVIACGEVREARRRRRQGYRPAVNRLSGDPVRPQGALLDAADAVGQPPAHHYHNHDNITSSSTLPYSMAGTANRSYPHRPHPMINLADNNNNMSNNNSKNNLPFHCYRHVTIAHSGYGTGSPRAYATSTGAPKTENV